MKIFRKAQSKILVLLTALLASSVCVTAGFNVINTQAEAQSGTELTYTDTEVQDIAFAQHPSMVYIGFRLTVSDYDDYEYQAGETVEYATYLNGTLSYITNFDKGNSEGVEINQNQFVYWNSGVGLNQLAVDMFKNTVAHRTTLQLLETGFTIMIPAGTTFPSLTYINGDKQDNTVLGYKTTSDKAFYYNGTTFKELTYSIAEDKMDALAEINSVKLSNYEQAEKDQIKALQKVALADIKVSVNPAVFDDVLANFQANVDALMTKAQYQALEVFKSEKITEVKTTLFDVLQESDYDATEWATILTMKESVDAVIGGCYTYNAVDEAVAGMQYAVNSVLTKDKKADFVAYRDNAWTRVENVFVEADYREAERAQGNALATACQQALTKASNYAEVDGILADYIVAINALNTIAEWEAEENANAGNGSSDGNKGEDSIGGTTVEEYIPNDDTLVDDNKKNKNGCGGVIIGCIIGVVLVAGGVAAYIFLVKKKDENEGAQDEEQEEKKNSRKEKKAAKKNGKKDGNKDEE